MHWVPVVRFGGYVVGCRGRLPNCDLILLSCFFLRPLIHFYLSFFFVSFFTSNCDCFQKRCMVNFQLAFSKISSAMSGNGLSEV